VLRASFWLAPSRFTNRPFDLPVEKTRDAFNRRLPPKRSACTRTSRVPGSLSPLSRRGVPTESWAPRGTSGDPDVSRRPWSLRRIESTFALLGLYCLTAWKPSVGVVFPRRRCDRASDTPVAILRFTLRLTVLSLVLRLHRSLARSYSGRGGTYGSEDAMNRQDHRGRRPVKADAS
jgi:hypothetical protein